MSPVPLLLAAVLILTTVRAQQPPLYTYLGEPYCTHGNSLINGRCWPSRSYRPYNARWPEVDRPRDPYEANNLIAPSTDEACPEGYKKSRGQCSKLTERGQRCRDATSSVRAMPTGRLLALLLVVFLAASVAVAKVYRLEDLRTTNDSNTDVVARFTMIQIPRVMKRPTVCPQGFRLVKKTCKEVFMT